MQIIRSIEFHSDSKEELLPGYSQEFPYIASQAEIDRHPHRFVPWHWHKDVELFYMVSGVLEYHTPSGIKRFTKGEGGFVNANIIHMTKSEPTNEETVQLLHIFDPAFIGDKQGGRIYQKYILPIISANQLEIIKLKPSNPQEQEIINELKESFTIAKDDFAYEIKLRNALSDIWYKLIQLPNIIKEGSDKHSKTSNQIKAMMIYIHENYPDKISVEQIANSAFVSTRECYRLFSSGLNTTPLEYLTSYRLQVASQMLINTQHSVAFISNECGLGSSSYFGKLFKDYTSQTPTQFREQWQDIDTNRR